RHDPVAHDLVDRALVAVDRLHHPLEDGIEQLARLLRVPISEQLHRALEVGEQDRDLLALPFERRLGGEDLLGEVLRSVGLRGAESRRGRRSSRVRTFGAEFGGRGQGPTALGAYPGQWRGALLAELRARLVWVLAARAAHQLGGAPDVPYARMRS